MVVISSPALIDIATSFPLSLLPTFSYTFFFPPLLFKPFWPGSAKPRSSAAHYFLRKIDTISPRSTYQLMTLARTLPFEHHTFHFLRQRSLLRIHTVIPPEQNLSDFPPFHLCKES